MASFETKDSSILTEEDEMSLQVTKLSKSESFVEFYCQDVDLEQGQGQLQEHEQEQEGQHEQEQQRENENECEKNPDFVHRPSEIYTGPVCVDDFEDCSDSDKYSTGDSPKIHDASEQQQQQEDEEEGEISSQDSKVNIDIDVGVHEADGDLDVPPHSPAACIISSSSESSISARFSAIEEIPLEAECDAQNDGQSSAFLNTPQRGNHSSDIIRKKTASTDFDDIDEAQLKLVETTSTLSSTYLDKQGEGSDDVTHLSMLKRCFVQCGNLANMLRDCALSGIVSCSLVAARWPVTCIMLSITLSIGLMWRGVKTNIKINTDFDQIFTPLNTKTMEHRSWLRSVDYNMNTTYLPKNMDQHYGNQNEMDSHKENVQQYLAEYQEEDPIFRHLLEQQQQESFLTAPDSILYHPRQFFSSQYESPLQQQQLDRRQPQLQWHRQTELNEAQGESSKVFILSVHANGENIVGYNGMDRTFQVIDGIQSLPGYNELCSQKMSDPNLICRIWGLPQLWDGNVTKFYEEVKSDEDAKEALKRLRFPDGSPIDLPKVIGRPKKDVNGDIVYGEMYLMFWQIAYKNQYHSTFKVLEQSILEYVIDLKEQWKDDPSNAMRVEILMEFSMEKEILRAILDDLHLIPMVFFIMVIFTCLVFAKCNRVQSRTALGFGAVFTILLSLVCAYGLMFIVGVPITPMTTMVPFVAFGVGLDDSFIIMGAYQRTDPRSPTEKRIRHTMKEVSLSITTTTLTTTLAFVLGLTSKIPAIYWVCWYAFTTIAIDFWFQITFFVALIVIDERRIKRNRMDCCICCVIHPKVPTQISVCDDGGGFVNKNSNKGRYPLDNDDNNNIDCKVDSITSPQITPAAPNPDCADRFMAWYAKFLLHPISKKVVIVSFMLYFFSMIYSTNKMEQEFQITSLLPQDSYAKDYAVATEKHSTRLFGSSFYFRFVDQTDFDIQNQMIDFIDQISELKEFGEEPPFCWVRDLHRFRQKHGALLNHMSGAQQINEMLSDPTVKETYGGQVFRNSTGHIILSKCLIFYNRFDMNDVNKQISFIRNVNGITASQNINMGKDEYPFFIWDGLYSVMEFYAVAVQELITTTIYAIAAVLIVGLIVVPHRSGVLFIFPVISILYVDLLGTMQYLGIHINAVSYIALVVSVGLMVDYIVHIVIRYYESSYVTREDKVIDALQTMGSSILVGGLSTLLGAIPLLFSSSTVLSTVFVTFFAMVCLSLLHGLVVLPVLLSICGPTDCATATKGRAQV